MNKFVLYITFLCAFALLSCQKSTLKVESSNIEKKKDTINVIYFDNKKIKEVDLMEYEGEKNVKLYFSEEGYLKKKTVNFDSYPKTNYEYNNSKIILHKWIEADIGGCVAISGKEFFMDEKGFVVKEIVHTSYGNSCSEKILINEIKEFFVKSKSIKTVYFTRESYEGSEECPCGSWKQFNEDGSLQIEQKLKNCENEISECDQNLSKNLTAINSKWYGNYFFTIRSEDDLDGTDYKIILNITRDSIIYSAEGYQIYQKFLLSGKEINDKLHLNYLASIDGSNSAVLQKTKDFGVIRNTNGSLVWESPYLNAAFSDKNKQHIFKK
ncbi:hypothetical protein [Frigoriflavimonas asaccharolytica]|uniref:Lipoprotein n=1 Tax=Frigoriflavimonas asaccharolytica TaxID=2735899 RepID=A0A8J8KCY2_9FLAO|nr:hypothetical protein [Frigoriflavimonas asaccharolytica]NRS94144.1 hypothetical protein [Frigoriflavimonas asaccharolytica]